MKNYNSRREFIKRSSLLTSGLALGLHKPLFAMNKKLDQPNKIGVALVGLGGYATIVANALKETEYIYLAGLVTGTPDKEKLWQEEYGVSPENTYNYENFDSIVTNDEIDVVYVTLPNHLHKEYTIRAARAGKHVICEKPMAMNAKECEQMIEVCEQEGVLLSIGYRLHYEPMTQEITRLGQNRVFGNIRYISASAAFHSMADGSAWRTKKKFGGGAMMDLGVYSLQAARYSTGMEPIAVSAQQFTQRPEIYTDCDETVTFQVEFPENILANLHASFYEQALALYISAENGWIKAEPFMTYGGLKGETSEGPLVFPEINQQAAQMDSIAQSIRNDTPLLVTGEEGLRDMVVIDAVVQSWESGGKRITLNP